MVRCVGCGLVCAALAAVTHGIRAGMIQFPKIWSLPFPDCGKLFAQFDFKAR